MGKKKGAGQYWNYRLVRYNSNQGPSLRLAEVYWEQDDGEREPKILFINDRPSISGETPKEVKEVLQRIAKDIDRGEIINADWRHGDVIQDVEYGVDYVEKGAN